MVLHQDRTQGDEDRAKKKRTDDAVEQDAVLILGRDRKVAEDDNEDEDVISAVPGFDASGAAWRVTLEFLTGYIVEKSLSVERRGPFGNFHEAYW